MHFLARFRVLTKILGIVAMLTVLLGTVAYLAIAALAAQNDNAEKMAAAAKRSLMAARANQSVIALNRAEFRGALDPSNENRSAAQEVIVEQLKLFHERMEEVRKTPDSQAQAMLSGVDEAFSAYEQSLKATMAAAEAASTAKITDSAEKLLDVTRRSSAAA